MKVKILFILCLILSYWSFSQVGIGTISPDNNTVLDINSNSKGILLPRLTNTQRDAIVSPTDGLTIYNTENHRFEYFNSTFWMALEAQRIDTPDLFISEYSEPTSGSGNDKYIEIYNPNSVAVTLTGNYAITVYFNGATSGTVVNLSGIVAANDVFVLYKIGASGTIISEGDQSTNDLNYNGDDAIALSKSGTVIDQIGIIGIDPGSGWDVAGTTEGTTNHVLQRKTTVNFGNTDWTTGSGTNITDSEWIVNPALDFSNLGTH